jgi:hypothetical protein
LKKKKVLSKKEQEAKNLRRNLAKMEQKKALEEKKKKKKKGFKKSWSQKDIDSYLKKNSKPEDFSCPSGGIVKSRYSK